MTGESERRDIKSKAERDALTVAAHRYAKQVLALHQALALGRLYLLDPKYAPTAVEDLVAILENATEPLRHVPVPPVEGETKNERAARGARRRRVENPEKYEASRQAIHREEKIKRRMAAGMSREMAEAHADSGSRLSPRGYDMDAEGYNPELDASDEDEFPPIPTVSIEELRRGDVV